MKRYYTVLLCLILFAECKKKGLAPQCYVCATVQTDFVSVKQPIETKTTEEVCNEIARDFILTNKNKEIRYTAGTSTFLQTKCPLKQ